MPLSGVPTFETSTANRLQICAQVDAIGSLGKEAVLKYAYSGLLVQCYGASDAELKTVFKKYAGTPMNEPDVIEGLPPGGPDDEWLVSPDGTRPPSPDPTAFNVSPSSLDVGLVAPGDLAEQLVTLSNQGGSPVRLLGASVSPASAGFTVGAGGANPCGASIAGGDACSLKVSFNPKVTGLANAQLRVQTSAGPSSVDLSGGADVVSRVTLSTSALDFGSTMVGSQTTPRGVTVTNVGTVPVSVDGAAANPGDVFPATSHCVSSLAPGESCTVDASFKPTAAGPASGILSIETSAGPHSVSLSGNASGAGIPTLSSTALAFGAQQINTTLTQSVTVRNTGDGPLTVSSNAVDRAPFKLNSSTCVGATLAKDAFCTITVEFTPTAQTAYAGTLTVVTDAGTRQASLSGTGSNAVLSISGTLSFSNLKVDVATGAQVTITNSGTGPANFLIPTFSGNSAATLTLGGHTCGNSLNANASCTVNYTVTPRQAGTNVNWGTVSVVARGLASVSRTITGSASVPVVAAPGVWSTKSGSTVAPTAADLTMSVARGSTKSVGVFLRNASTTGALTSSFTISGDTQHFAFLGNVTKVTDGNFPTSCATVAAASTGTCTADSADGGASVAKHMYVTVQFRPMTNNGATAGTTYKVVLTPTAPGAGSLTITGRVP